MPIAFLGLLLEDKIQLSVHHTESDQSIYFEDFTPWSICFCYMTPVTWFSLFFQSAHPKVLIKTCSSESSKFAVRSHSFSVHYTSCFLILEAMIDDCAFILTNLRNPNTEKEKVSAWPKMNLIRKTFDDLENKIVIFREYF